jgi:hypothetical protein
MRPTPSGPVQADRLSHSSSDPLKATENGGLDESPNIFVSGGLGQEESSFLAVIGRDAADSLAAMELVLAQQH